MLVYQRVMNRGFGHCYGHQILTRVPLDSITRHLGRPCHCGRGHQRLRGSCQVTWAHRAAGHFNILPIVQTCSNLGMKGTDTNFGGMLRFWTHSKIRLRCGLLVTYLTGKHWTWSNHVSTTSASMLGKQRGFCHISTKTGYSYVFLGFFGKSAVEICCFTAATKQPATHCILPCCTSDTPRCREGAGAMAQSWPAPSGPWMAMGPTADRLLSHQVQLSLQSPKPNELYDLGMGQNPGT